MEYERNRESGGAQKTVINPLQKSVGGEFVDFTGLKKLARDRLPKESSLKALILSEPDLVRREEARVMIPMFAKLLYRELKP